MEIKVPTLPEEAVQFTRLFNGLTGEELRAHILRQLKTRLDKDGRLGAHIAHGIVSWRWKLDILTQPAANDHLEFEMKGGIIQVDEETGEWQGVKPEDAKWPISIFIPMEMESGILDSPDKVRKEIGVDAPVVQKRKGMPMDEGISVEIDDGMDESLRLAIEKQKPRTGQIVEESPLVRQRSRVDDNLSDRQKLKLKMQHMKAEEIAELDDPRINKMTIDKDMTMSQVARERMGAAGGENIEEAMAKAQMAADAALSGEVGVVNSDRPVVEGKKVQPEDLGENVEQSKLILEQMRAQGLLPDEGEATLPKGDGKPVEKQPEGKFANIADPVEDVLEDSPKKKAEIEREEKLDMMKEMVDAETDSK
jgi:hypothetical protein